MADQVGSGTVHGSRGESAGLAARTSAVPAVAGTAPSWRHEPFHGRPVSWVSTVIIIVGFIIGGIGLVTGPAWWAFWTGVGIGAVGGILGLSIGIFNDWY
jgi:hypothetical protein